jgi:TonB family protein
MRYGSFALAVAVLVASSGASVAGAAGLDGAGESGIAPQPIGNVGDWFPLDAYPAAARRMHEEGRVMFRLDIDATGTVTACTVVGSSGSTALDAVTCDLARANAHFKPAVGTDGKPISSTWSKAIKWAIQDEGRLPARSFSIVERINVAPDGTRLSCTSQAQGDPAKEVGAPCTIFDDAAGLRRMKGPFADRHAIVTTQMSLRMDGDPPVLEEHRVKGRTTVSVARATFDIAPDGTVINCRITESKTLDGIGPTRLCLSFIGPFAPITEASGSTPRSGAMLASSSVEPAQP